MLLPSRDRLYDSFAKTDLTDMLPQIIEQWSRLNPHFDGILTGFLLCAGQYEYVLKFIEKFKQQDTLLLVDPVMGDNGKIYDTYTPKMIEGVKNFVPRRILLLQILPNLKF